MAEYFKLYREPDRGEIVETVDDEGEAVTFGIGVNDESRVKTLYAIGDERTDIFENYGFEEFTVSGVGDTGDKWEFREDDEDTWQNSLTISDIDNQRESFQVRATSGEEDTQTDTTVEIEVDAQVKLTDNKIEGE